jgi:hypothetical protein
MRNAPEGRESLGSAYQTSLEARDRQRPFWAGAAVAVAAAGILGFVLVSGLAVVCFAHLLPAAYAGFAALLFWSSVGWLAVASQATSDL